MSRNSKLHDAVRLALGVSAGFLTLSIAPGVMAQDAEANAPAIEEIVTTGSRIKRADIDSASPVTVVDRAAIIATGITDVGDLIQSMPSMSGSPIGTTTNNGGNGSVQIDLRGLGSNRTLTLINGQRTVDGGDYTTIPVSMIERVEILKDGASAIYGADAVAGVVNIITRRDYDGLEIAAQTADWMDSKGKQDSFNVVSGAEFQGGNFVFGAEFVKQEAAYQADTPWDFMKDSYYIYPEGCENQVTAPYDGTPTGGCYPLGSSRIPESRLRFPNNGTFYIDQTATNPYEAGLMAPYDGRNYNYAPVNYLQTPYERFNLFAEAHFEISEKMRGNVEIRGNFRESRQELAPLPYTPGDPFYDGFFDLNGDGTVQPYSGISDQNYYLRQAIDTYNAANGTALVYEPVIDARRRMIETKRAFEQEITQFQFVAGLEGDLDNGMSWDLFLNEGYRSRTDVDFGQFAGARLANALGPSADLDGNGQPECYTDINDPNTLINGCVPLNLFGGGTVERATGAITSSSVTQDMIDYVAIDLVDTYVTKQTVTGGNITGEAFDLPGGALGWAAGVQYLKDEFKYTPDSAKQSGAATGNVGAGTIGSLTTQSVFAEVLAPVFDNGTQEIMLKAGLRYDDFDRFDAETTYQLGVELQAIEDLKLRGTYGTVYRAPNISELFGGIVDSFPQYVDPCTRVPLPAGCAQVGLQLDTQVRAAVGGNENLIPESGDTYTVGVVWTPSFGDHNFTGTVDYWSVELEDGINSLGAQFVLDNCYEDQNADACALVTRNADYAVTLVQDAALNLTSQTAKGVDTEIRWNFSSSIGDWEASMLWAHMLERNSEAFPGAGETEFAGRFTAGSSAFAEDKMNYKVQWMQGGFTVAYLGEYISALDADTFCNCGTGNQPDGSYIQKIDSQLYHDLVASYSFSDYGMEGLTLAGGITNFTDEAPPFIEVGFNAGTDPSTYRMFGRGYYLRATYKF